ncbi:MAG: hypothetical protein HY913_04270 [Desulfomonile tiedjei]|nr:hypothetical protein [Desulfomonile tiedjei]
MRELGHAAALTPFGIWIRENCKQVHLIVTNLDYVLFEYDLRRMMLLEEKQYFGRVHRGQQSVFKILDQILSDHAASYDIDYWGFYLLQFRSDGHLPGPDMRLNGYTLTEEALIRHLNFEEQIVPPRKMN